MHRPTIYYFFLFYDSARSLRRAQTGKMDRQSLGNTCLDDSECKEESQYCYNHLCKNYWEIGCVEDSDCLDPALSCNEDTAHCEPIERSIEQSRSDDH